MRKFQIFIFCILCSAAGCLEDETGDFTSGSYYPTFPEDTTEEEVDPDPVDTIPPPPCWDEVIIATRSDEFNERFTRYGDGWTGGDATYSVYLPDGRTVWIFGDTFLGTVNEDRSRPGTGLINNSFVVQDGDQMTTLYTGTPSNAKALIIPPEPGWWYWPTDGTVYMDTLQIMLSAFRSTGGGIFGFAYAAIDIARFSLPDLQLIDINRKILDPTIAFGAAVMEGNDGYTYVYGVEKEGINKYLHIARAANGDISDDWEYFNGTDWVSDISQSQRLMNDVSEQFGIFNYEGHNYMITHNHIFGKQIYLWESPTPEGPWTFKNTVYCTPETGGDIWTYNSFVHPQFMENEELLVSYNNNSFNFGDLFRNADNYRPHFVRIANWK